MSNVLVQNLTKQYGKHMVFENINCTFQEGKISGLLGNNGEGKTTMLNILTNRIFATSGNILVDGESTLENDRALSKIYYMSEKTLDKEDEKVGRVIKKVKTMYPDMDVDYAHQLAAMFELDLKKKMNKLSTGYRSIVKIVLALSCNAPVLAFDEPVLGLDAKHREMFYKELLKRYQEKGMTVILSTHIIEEVADLIENVVILDSGRIMVESTVEDLKSRYYVVSGNAAKVDEYIADKDVVFGEEISGFKSVTLKGEKPAQDADGLQFSKSELQKLFVNLTSGGKQHV